MLYKVKKKKKKKLLRKIIFKQKYFFQGQSSAKVLEFQGDKWVIASPRFAYFINWSDYNIKWELSKLQFTEKEKVTLSIGFFFNAVWFATSITWTRQNKLFYI